MARQAPLLSTILVLTLASFFASALSYTRPPPGKDVFLRRSEDDDPTRPQQVHISIVGPDKMRISWITEGPSPPTVTYRESAGGSDPVSVTGTSSTYRYLTYESGQINDAVIGPLKPNTVYNYSMGSNSAYHYSFKSPPSQFPIRFAVVGDLGQTEWTRTTLQHISTANYDMLLLPGDLSYADFVQPMWDSFGRLVEPLASQRPWMVTHGNHEVEKIPILHRHPFTAYNARWRMPFRESGSESNLYYSFDAAGVHVVMLGSYADFDPSSPQYRWLEADLGKVDRGRTPWIVAVIHAPWYSSNTAHQGERESVDMKKYMEKLLFQTRVDVIFAGHVHAYERFSRVYQDEANGCGPVHITIGDGGNREGLAKHYIDPKPDISVFREASFGHALLDVVNATHALWTWHINDEDERVISDSVWLNSLSSNPSCKPLLSK